MKISSIWSLTALAACAAADDAYLWTVDHGAAKYPNTQASSISSEAASSMIARRRGVTDDQYQASPDGRALKDANQYGGYQVPMYGSESDRLPAKLFIKISGFTGTISSFSALPELWVEDAARDLDQDFTARKNVDGVCEYNLQVPTKDGVDLVYSYFSEDSTCKSAHEIRVRPAILAVFSTVPVAKDAPQGIGKLVRTLSHLAVTENLESTILVLPPKSKLLKPKPVRRAEPSEEPFELPSTAPEPSSPSFSSMKASNSSHPLPRVIPQCFTSKESCENTTNSCSGHGSCGEGHKGCFKCLCGRTLVRKNADGSEKHVQWGGNACQKKDISMEFVLLASFAVVMTALIAGAIGAMYTMGSQELPSVIGAGVSGPKASK